MSDGKVERLCVFSYGDRLWTTNLSCFDAPASVEIKWKKGMNTVQVESNGESTDFALPLTIEVRERRDPPTTINSFVKKGSKILAWIIASTAIVSAVASILELFQ